MSAMTASSSKPLASRQPQNAPLPSNSEKPVKQSNSHKKRKMGKEKDRQSTTLSSRRVGSGSEAEWDHAKAGTEPWSWTSLTDSSVSKHPPIFTNDGSYFFAIVGSSVKIHSCATGQVVSTLSGSPMGSQSSDVITSAILNPNNAFQLITGSLDGRIQIWDFLDAVLLQTISIEHSIFHLCAHEKFPDYVFVAATKSNKNKNNFGHEREATGLVLRVSLKPKTEPTGSRAHMSSEITSVGKTRSIVGLCFSQSGSWLVAVAGHKAYVAATSSLKSGFTKYVSPEALTCLAFHPSEDYFATGDDKGNIRMWYCLDDHAPTNSVGVEKRAQTTTLHWHAHAVSSLSFTPNGAYLLSGGEESVLVIWQLHTGKKEFVPRVGAPISTIAVATGGDSEEYLLGLVDATFTFVSAATLKISRSYSRIKLDPEAAYSGLPVPAPLAIHSTTSTLILPSSHPSSLQTYSPSTSTLIGELEVSPSNRVSRRDETPILASRVEHAVISFSGEWMATIDERDGDDSFRGEIYLKIWWWDSKTGFWILNTRVDRPHGLERVSSIAFSPEVKDRHSLQLVTTGDDLNIRVWRLRTVIETGGQIEESWVTRSSFGFRRERPIHASFSPDGSLLCISFGGYGNLYDSVSNVLLHTLASPHCKLISSCGFVGRKGRFMVMIGVWDIILWDLTGQSVRWHHRSLWPIDRVISHPRGDSFAILHCASVSPRLRRPTTPISIFTAASSTPQRKFAVPFGFLNAAWYPSTSIPSSPNISLYSLVGITNNYSVVLFGDDISPPVHEGASANAIVGGATLGQTKTLFQDIFGSSAFVNLSERQDHSSAEIATASMDRFGDNLTGLLDGPAYLMPPIESLFEPLIGNFIQLKSQEAVVEFADNEPYDEDIEMTGLSDTETMISGIRQERDVVATEMELFTDLFKDFKVSSNSAGGPITNAIPSKPNGKAGQLQPSASLHTMTANGIKRPTTTSSRIIVADEIHSPPVSPTRQQTNKRRRPSDQP